MANHVTTRLILREGNEAATDYFRAMCDKCDAIYQDIKEKRELAKEAGEKYEGVTDVNLWNLNEDTIKMVEDKDWSALIDKIGTKWAYVDDWMPEQLTIVAAWGVPEDFINRVAEEVGELDPKAIISIDYDDEGPNFIGCALYAEGEQWDSFQVDSEEYSDYELAFWWDEDEHDGEEEPDDFEPTWDAAWSLLEGELDDMVDGFKNYVEEREFELAEEELKYSGE